MAAESSWWKNHVDPDLARGPAVLGPDLGDLDPAPVDPGLGRTGPKADPRAEDLDPDPVHNPVIDTVVELSAVLGTVLDPPTRPGTVLDSSTGPGTKLVSIIDKAETFHVSVYMLYTVNCKSPTTAN